jgi:hypothetical protein
VSVDFLVKKPIPNLRVFIDILDYQSELVFRSFHDDDFDTPEKLAEGLYRSTARIPPDLLAPQQYTLRIGATVYGSHNCTGNHICIPFRLFQEGRVNRAYSYEVYLGKVAPLINWHTEQI